jgi:hypothetical protein
MLVHPAVATGVLSPGVVSIAMPLLEAAIGLAIPPLASLSRGMRLSNSGMSTAGSRYRIGGYRHG